MTEWKGEMSVSLSEGVHEASVRVAPEDGQSPKERYSNAIRDFYVPLYSQPWWMDAVCGPENWDAWVCENDGDGHIDAVMPYYMERRGEYRYITKAPLTQNNGIIFNYPANAKKVARAKFEERVINAACEHIRSLGADVYEQQFQTSFTNWLPFFWNRYQAIVRYTYVFSKETLSDLDTLFREMDHNKRNKIMKAERLCAVLEDLNPADFYREVEKTYAKQGLGVPFSFELWMRVYRGAEEHHCGKIYYAVNPADEIVSAMFVAWDSERMYQLISGGDVLLQRFEGKSALVWRAIQDAAALGLAYDFEGSVIPRISKSNRLFGAEPVPYFRIRKVFNPAIIRAEAESAVEQLTLSEGKS